MVKRDVIGGLAWLGFGSLFVLSALKQGLFLRGLPGPGFMPFFTGMALAALSLVVLVPGLLKNREGKENGEKAKGGELKAFYAIAALLAYGFLLEPLGYLISTFAFVFFLSSLVAKRKWWVGPLVAFLASGLTYLLFVIVLEVSLPKGVLGFI